MTGVEAVSNGVPAFKPPEAKNASITLMIMAAFCVSMFMGITLLAHAFNIVPTETETVISMLARTVFHGRGLPYYLMQAATMLILVLAANTAYADFPRLASLVARDRYLPRQFMNVGDRLAFSNGIVLLAGAAVLLVWIYGADSTRLIQLYIVGVFVSFTLSQTGMVRHWNRHLRTEKDPAKRRHMVRSRAINTFGAFFTGLVLIVVGALNVEDENGKLAILVGILLASLAGLDTAVRDHFSGFRSHSTLLAGFPAALLAAVLAYFGPPMIVVALVAVGVFVGCFFLLRNAFKRRTGVSFKV